MSKDLFQLGAHRTSGVCYSSWLRPLVNMRPDSLLTYQNFGGGSPHQLSADLCLVDWLHEQSYEFDVVTDEDLHREGRELLAPYRVVLTGTHAEYWSSEMLDAMGDYLAGGGKLMYLSGNGMCCNTQLDPEEGHTVEMRRFGVHTQWFGDPGERHFSTTGARSGLWRDGGRPEHGLIGVGFASAGSGPGRPYERQSGSFDPHVSFIFEGLGADELIGDFPSLINGHGAAAYEIDRLNFDLGTPHHTILLASATSFAADYSNGLPEWSYADGQSGPGTEPPVRADMVYVDYPKGGAVFSVSSIGWCGCLSYNNYDNNVSRITRNVLDRFSRTASAK